MDKNAAGKQQKKHNFIVQQKQRLVDYQLQEQRLRQLEEESKREQEAADLALQQLAAAKLKRGRLLQQQGNRLPPPTQKFERGDEEDVSIPFDPNLICPMCGKQFRVGEIQILRLHINNLCSEELDDEFSDRDKENSYMERNNTQSETVSYMVTHFTAITVRNGMLKLQFKFNLLCVCHGNIAKDQTFPWRSLSLSEI